MCPAALLMQSKGSSVTKSHHKGHDLKIETQKWSWFKRHGEKEGVKIPVFGNNDRGLDHASERPINKSFFILNIACIIFLTSTIQKASSD